MDPALKEYLDSLKGDMAQLQRSVDTRLDAVMHKQDSLVQQLTNQSDRLTDLCGWKPDLEARFADLQATVADLKRAQPSLAAAASGSEMPGAYTAPPFVNKGAIHGQFGHGDSTSPGGSAAVAPVPPSLPPVTGTISLQHPLAATADPLVLSSHIIAGLGPNAPAFPFPPFTGDNPNLWITLAEQYFQMFSTHESYWVPMSILHFSGAAGIWLQSMRKKIAALDWISFTSLLCTRFGRDRHQLLIRQFYSIKQTTSVTDYIE
jgi:hypothetical protein